MTPSHRHLHHSYPPTCPICHSHHPAHHSAPLLQKTDLLLQSTDSTHARSRDAESMGSVALLGFGNIGAFSAHGGIGNEHGSGNHGANDSMAYSPRAGTSEHTPPRRLLPCLNCMHEIKCLFCEKKLSSFTQKYFMRKYFVGGEKRGLREKYWQCEEEWMRGDTDNTLDESIIFTCSSEEMADLLAVDEVHDDLGQQSEAFIALLNEHYPLFLAAYFLSLQSFPLEVRHWIWKKYLKNKKIRRTSAFYCCKWCVEKQITTEGLVKNILLDFHLEEYFTEKQNSSHLESVPHFAATSSTSPPRPNTLSITATPIPQSIRLLSQLYSSPHHVFTHTQMRTPITLDSLSDDMITYVCSYLHFPRCMFTLSAVCESLRDFFLNRTNFSWVTQILLSNLGPFTRTPAGIFRKEILIDSDWIYLFTKLFSDLKSFGGFTNLTTVSIVNHTTRPSDFAYICFFSGLYIDVSKLSSISLPSWSHYLNSYFLKNGLKLHTLQALDICQDPLMESANVLGSLLDMEHSRGSSSQVGDHFLQGNTFKFFRFVPPDPAPMMRNLTVLSLYEGVLQTSLLSILPSLRRLYLRKCAIYDDAADGMVFPLLQVFHCKYAPVSGHSLRFFSRIHTIFPTLNKLAVYGPEEYLQTCLHHAQQLICVNIRVSVIHLLSAVHALANCQHVEVLKVNIMRDFSSELISKWHIQPSLKHFECMNFQMSTQSISALIRCFPSLESLMLNDTSSAYQSDLSAFGAGIGTADSGGDKSSSSSTNSQKGLFTLLFQYLSHLKHISVRTKNVIPDIVSSIEYMKRVETFCYRYKGNVGDSGTDSTGSWRIPASVFMKQLSKMSEDRRQAIEIFHVNIMIVDSEQQLLRLAQMLRNLRELHCCITSHSVLSKRVEQVFVRRRVTFRFEICEGSSGGRCLVQ